MTTTMVVAVKWVTREIRRLSPTRLAGAVPDSSTARYYPPPSTRANRSRHHHHRRPRCLCRFRPNHRTAAATQRPNTRRHP